ncbi:MAG TPA: class I SAM-dependent methyltransferase [Geminicoccaceae bacterium]|jgi:methionine biosynthesis protein MetW|nr:class I SAM-dependent methyltransferase [Geminicoccaceae bacterium]
MIDRSLNYGRPIVRRFLEMARPYQRVLDLGAGNGVDLLAARAVQPGCALHAVEVHRPNVELLLRQGIEVIGLDLERDSLTFDDGTIDLIIANQVLEHTKEVFWIWHEIARVLRIGGQVILGVPNLASAHNRLLLLLGRQPSVIKTASAHVRGFTRSDVCDFLERAYPRGFALRDWAGANFYPLPPVLARPMARVLPGLAWGMFLLFSKQRDYRGEFLSFPARARLETNFYTGPRSA